MARDEDRTHCETQVASLGQRGAEREERDARRHSDAVNRIDRSISQLVADQVPPCDL
jgi:hypothetical protein